MASGRCGTRARGPFSLCNSYFFGQAALSNLNAVQSHIPFRNPDPANVVRMPDAVVWRVAMVLVPSVQGFNGTGASKMDIFVLAIGVVFFALCFAYVKACDIL
jgi:hypothetical protein